MDNYYTSPALFDELASKKTGACGTLRLNRQGVPQNIKTTKLKKGEPIKSIQEGIKLYISWFDKKQVKLLTTIHNTSVFERTVRAKWEPEHRRTVMKPGAVQLYTDYMRGVDLIDQKIAYNLHTHRSLKWWKKIFMVLLEICVRHTDIICRRLHSRVVTKKIRHRIVHGLLEGHKRLTISAHRPPVDPPHRLTERYWPEPIPRTPAGSPVCRDCIVCSDRGKKRCQTQTRCHQCGYTMCMWPCWMRYHTLMDYKATCSREYHQPANQHPS